MNSYVPAREKVPEFPRRWHPRLSFRLVQGLDVPGTVWL